MFDKIITAWYALQEDIKTGVVLAIITIIAIGGLR